MKVGDRVVRNPSTWVPSEFDSWGRGVGVGVILPDTDGICDGDSFDVRWPGGRCIERAAGLLPEPTSPDNLTDRQRAVLDHIRSKITEQGYAPTLREIGEALGMKSTNGVQDHVKALEKKGYIRRTYGTARSIVLTEQALRGTL